MKQYEIADYFNMNVRTFIRFKQAKHGTWRKKLYYLMMEEALKIEKKGK